MNELIANINKLPAELINLIKEYVQKQTLAFVNKTHYILHHSLIKSLIRNYESFIRDVIKRDNAFVFERIVKENVTKWFRITKYTHNSYTFNNYAHFIIYFCVENESHECRKIAEQIFKEHGLCKNLHKKNIIKYIKWKV